MSNRSQDPKSESQRDIHSLTHGELLEALSSLNQPSFRAKQIEEWVWSKNARSFDDMTNLPKVLREELARRFTMGAVEEVARQASSDGSRKYLLRLSDGVTVEYALEGRA